MCACVCSAPAEQQAWEEGCAESEATTGGDYSDDTLFTSDEEITTTVQYVDKEKNANGNREHLQINLHERWVKTFKWLSRPVLLYILQIGQNLVFLYSEFDPLNQHFWIKQSIA